MERNTRQRSAIRDVIARAERPLLPQEVLDAAQTLVPGLGIATVYRNIRMPMILSSGLCCTAAFWAGTGMMTVCD